ncbi:hypothetical protein P171DRAFT_77119 [Karstenula rhodostoma CBS 690.94]|uniref:Uncharacterized protein n=1 Tax=Karstenula rhodostoma CBS 690.94 TaxID=1392251 RepID=A0A9P4PB17_9PLEO|nr:hypothetical protein P171DRAFT_77119 [Karstenula rhodostoma CBS 690.94]
MVTIRTYSNASSKQLQTHTTMPTFHTTSKMRPSTITLAAMATLFSTVSAWACTEGPKCCGHNLLHISIYSPSCLFTAKLSPPLLMSMYAGKYCAEIDQELYRKHIGGDENHIKNSVFQCASDESIV